LKIHQDSSRNYLGGESSYSRIIENLGELPKYQEKVGIITVLTKSNFNDLEKIVLDFEKRGIDSVSFSLVGSKDKSIYPNPEDLSSNMIGIFNRYISKAMQDSPTIKIRNLRDLLRTFFKNKITSNCVQCGGGRTHPLIAIDIDGSIYPCDYFWGREDYQIGNISDTPLKDCLNSCKNFRVYRDISMLEDCSYCDWRAFCGGGCPGMSTIEGKGISAKSSYCNYFKNIFEYAAKIIPLIHKGNKLDLFLN